MAADDEAASATGEPTAPTEQKETPGERIKAVLGYQIGPLPVGIWLIVLPVGILTGLWIRNYFQSRGTNATSTPVDNQSVGSIGGAGSGTAGSSAGSASGAPGAGSGTSTKTGNGGGGNPYATLLGRSFTGGSINAAGAYVPGGANLPNNRGIQATDIAPALGKEAPPVLAVRVTTDIRSGHNTLPVSKPVNPSPFPLPGSKRGVQVNG